MFQGTLARKSGENPLIRKHTRYVAEERSPENRRSVLGSFHYCECNLKVHHGKKITQIITACAVATSCCISAKSKGRPKFRPPTTPTFFDRS